LDRVRGAAHFEVTPERARVLQNEIRERLPGYLVPRFVFEQPGRKSKLPLDYQQP
jgi:L-lysine 2,3-aminomutase